MPDSQLAGGICTVTDDPDTAKARGDETAEGLTRLAKALNFQLRFRESIEIYDRLIKESPDDRDLIRTRAARFLNTLQPERAAADLLKCREFGMDEGDISYRLGIAYYLGGDYTSAMEETEKSFALVGDEMGIAAMYWNTLAAWKKGVEPELLGMYHKDMEVGHHTSYERVMALAAGELSEEEFSGIAGEEPEDLEYAMLGYGYACYLEHRGNDEKAACLLRSVVSRDSFWIAYGYLAAWNELNGGPAR